MISILRLNINCKKILYLCYNYFEDSDGRCNMKKNLILFTVFVVFFIFDCNIDALCYDQELNDWATNVKINRIDFDKDLIDETTNKPIGEKYNYAYIIALDSYRDDIVMKATSNYNDKLTAKYIPGHKVYGVMNYNVPGSIHYDITVYGSEDSACPNEVLKTFTLDLGPLNVYSKKEVCNEYPDAPMCEVYKDTSNLTYDEFKLEMDEYIKEVESKKPLPWYKKIFKIFAEYILYLVVPFIIIAVIYTFKIEKVKREERDK